MKKVLFSAMALTMSLMMLISCNKDKKDPKEAIFTANIEQHNGQQNRTAINPENGMVKWLAGDKILIANDNGESAQFTLQSGAGNNEGTFSTAGEFEMEAPFTAAYPQNATINGTTATFTLPATQTLTQPGTFANGANPMAAYGTDDNLYFRNLCGALDIRLLGDNIHVSGIRITGADGEKLNGTFAVDCSANEPAMMASQGSNGTNIVTLNCDVTLTSTTTAQEFFIVLPVGALAQGFTMDVLDGENVVCTKTLETNLAQIVRNEVKRFNPLLIVTETPTPIELPDVVTNAVTDITTTTATVGGEILSDGGSAITECGVCYKTGNEDWTCIALTATNNAFSTTLTDLTPNTTYTVRAYATNEGGTGYGDEVTFTTEEEIIITVPTVTTNEISEFAATTATGGGTVTDMGNGTISECGVCWSTDVNPTTEDNYATSQLNEGAFTVNMTDLSGNTTYYVRAYATNEAGTGYGEQVSFKTLPEGIINGLFTINANGDQVYFSQGNLQYNKTTNEWSFMEHQYDMVETAWQEIGENYANQNIVSLFGWGTSGYNHGAVCYQPLCTSNGVDDYYAYGSYTYNLYDLTGKADWGYNAISNGGNTENLWRTMTSDEWDYVFNTRNTTSGIRWVMGTIDGMNGVILLPDNWDASIYALNNTNPYQSQFQFEDNSITVSNWINVLEANGAIFLPAAGRRWSTSVSNSNSGGFYWSATKYPVMLVVYSWTFSEGNLDIGNAYRSYGYSVRLVRNAE